MTTQTFSQSIKKLLSVEGGYSNDPADSGGRTKFGITGETALNAGYTGDIKDLDIEQAKAIYKIAYWDKLRLDDIATLSEPIADELFDTGVNCGIGTAGRFLQRALNAFNRQQVDYADEVIDGVIGILTLQQLRRYLVTRPKDGEVVLLRALNSLQGARYITLAEQRVKDERFIFGWFLNRVQL